MKVIEYIKQLQELQRNKSFNSQIRVEVKEFLSVDTNLPIIKDEKKEMERWVKDIENVVIFVSIDSPKANTVYMQFSTEKC